MSRFKTCRKQYWFEYELLLRSVEDAYALRFGDAFHKAAEILSLGCRVAGVVFLRNTTWNEPYTPHTLAALFRAYVKRYEECGLIDTHIETETVFEFPIRNPETTGTSQTFVAGGKRDGVVRLHDGRIANREMKTTSEDIARPRYWARLLIDSQVSLYCMAEEGGKGRLIESTVYDVIRKPGMAPLLATPVEKRKYKKDGDLYASQREFDETPEEWEERLYEDTQQRPEFYFARREVSRLDKDLHEFRQELWDVAKDIRQAQLTGRWYRNSGRMTCDFCPFFDLCIGLAPWDGESVPEGFQRLDNPNPELEVDDAVTSDPATTSDAEEQRGEQCTPVYEPANAEAGQGEDRTADCPQCG